MRRCLPVVLACTLAACTGGGGRPVPERTPIVGAVVDLAKVVLSAPVGGIVTVSGSAGCVSGPPVSTVTLTIVRETVPAMWRLQHLAGGLPIASGYAVVTADGGFGATRMGAADRPVQAGDELNITPQQGTSQAGYPVAIKVP